jgi:hypothetical protein
MCDNSFCLADINPLLVCIWVPSLFFADAPHFCLVLPIRDDSFFPFFCFSLPSLPQRLHHLANKAFPLFDGFPLVFLPFFFP